jgi:predicted amidophosphoribosyltransferase
MDERAFMECDTCRAKSGTPLLCEGCRHNLSLIGRMRGCLQELYESDGESHTAFIEAEELVYGDEGVLFAKTVSEQPK